MPLQIDSVDTWSRTDHGVIALFTARVRPGRVDILRDGTIRVDSFAVPPGTRLREVLATNGWRPTGRTLRSGGHEDLIVEAIKQTRP
jgi:hypothetical protein